VPNIKRADELSLKGLRQGDRRGGGARQGRKNHGDDLAGGSFSVSNPGIRGNLFGGAIIAQPNAAFCEWAKIQKRVVVVDVEGQDTMAIHPVMYLALSYDSPDHRRCARQFLSLTGSPRFSKKGEFEV